MGAIRLTILSLIISGSFFVFGHWPDPQRTINLGSFRDLRSTALSPDIFSYLPFRQLGNLEPTNGQMGNNSWD